MHGALTVSRARIRPGRSSGASGASNSREVGLSGPVDNADGGEPGAAMVVAMTGGITRITLRIAVTGVLLTLLTGCPGTPEPSGSLPPTPSATPSSTASAMPSPSTSLTDEQQILAQYKRFWLEALPAAFSAPASQRRSILEPVVTDPELTVLVDNLAALNERGEKDYGVNRPLRQTVEIRQNLSLVTGCLDSSGSGVAEAKTGRKKTKGVPQNPVRVNLRRTAGQAWRVSAVTYPGGRSC